MRTRHKWYIRLFFAVILVSLWFVILRKAEEQINPVGWDLETYQEIQRIDQLVKENIARSQNENLEEWTDSADQ